MRTSQRLVVVVVALATTTLFALPLSADSKQNVSVRRHVIEIQKLKFVPADIQVSPGDTIVWVNKDFVPHTTTAKDKSWGSKTIKKDGQWQIVVQTGMPEDYFCKFHPSMKGRLRIVD